MDWANSNEEWIGLTVMKSELYNYIIVYWAKFGVSR